MTNNNLNIQDYGMIIGSLVMTPSGVSTLIGVDACELTGSDDRVWVGQGLTVLDYSINEVKPIRRTLSDMKQDEAIEVLKLAIAHTELTGPTAVLMPAEHVKETLTIKYFGGKSKLVPSDVIVIDRQFNVTDEMGHFCNMTNIVKYLLLCGFDCFGWISENLAIDKATVVK